MRTSYAAVLKIIARVGGEGHGDHRRGSAAVLALMVTMLLIILLLATMTLTITDIEQTEDYARNKKTLQASDSGIAHGKLVMAHALSSFSMPAYKNEDDIDQYAADSQSSDPTTQLSLLFDTGQYFEDDLYTNDWDATGVTENPGSGGLHVAYEADGTVKATGVEPAEDGDITHKTTFHYDYEIASRGTADIGAQYNQATRARKGSFDVEVKRPSFSTYGYFTQTMKNQYDDQLVFFDGETYDGPTHVNSAPPEGRAGFYGQPIFNGPFSAVQSSYEDSWLGGNADPIFNDTVAWGVDPITLPDNGWSQLRAAVGDMENVDNTTPPAGGWDSYLASFMQLSDSPATLSEGVYYAPDYNDGANLLGGILVWGDAASISMDASGTGQQKVTITMNNTDGGHFDGSHSWTFRSVGDRTYVSVDGGSETQYNQKLNGMIHTQGKVLALGGQGSDTPDIETDAKITVSATDDIYIADNLTYKTDPIANPNADNVLGIFSSNGNIWLSQDAPENLQIDATMMAASDGHGVGTEGLAVDGTYDYYYPFKGTWSLLGGLIENKNQTTSVYYSNGHQTGYLWNFTYDDRFLTGHAPPFFPYVTKFQMQVQNLEAKNWGRKY